MLILTQTFNVTGGVAQMVERSLSMREVPGSIPGASKVLFFLSPRSHHTTVLSLFLHSSLSLCMHIMPNVSVLIMTAVPTKKQLA